MNTGTEDSKRSGGDMFEPTSPKNPFQAPREAKESADESGSPLPAWRRIVSTILFTLAALLPLMGVFAFISYWSFREYPLDLLLQLFARMMFRPVGLGVAFFFAGLWIRRPSRGRLRP